MGLQQLKDTLPDFAKDTRLNLSSILNDEGAPGLSSEQRLGVILTSAQTIGNSRLIKAAIEEATSLDEKTKHAIGSAVTLMGMNNIYYRFLHFMDNKDLSSMPAKLRMSAIGNPGIDKADFELYSLAASIVTGCEMCCKSHGELLLKHGVPLEGIQSVARIASILNAVAKGLSSSKS